MKFVNVKCCLLLSLLNFSVFANLSLADGGGGTGGKPPMEDGSSPALTQAVDISPAMCDGIIAARKNLFYAEKAKYNSLNTHLVFNDKRLLRDALATQTEILDRMMFLLTPEELQSIKAFEKGFVSKEVVINAFDRVQKLAKSSLAPNSANFCDPNKGGSSNVCDFKINISAEARTINISVPTVDNEVYLGKYYMQLPVHGSESQNVRNVWRLHKARLGRYFTDNQCVSQTTNTSEDAFSKEESQNACAKAAEVDGFVQSDKNIPKKCFAPKSPTSVAKTSEAPLKSLVSNVSFETKAGSQSSENIAKLIK